MHINQLIIKHNIQSIAYKNEKRIEISKKNEQIINRKKLTKYEKKRKVKQITTTTYNDD